MNISRSLDYFSAPKFRAKLVAVALVIILLLQTSLQGVEFSFAQSSEPVELSGRLNVEIRDRATRNGLVSETVYSLTDASGKHHLLNLSGVLAGNAEQIRALSSKAVTVKAEVTLNPYSTSGQADQVVVAKSIEPVNGIGILHGEQSNGGANRMGTPPAPVTGSFPYLVIPCKYNDVAIEPRNQAYFTGLFGAAAPGFDHYIQEMSYGAVNLNGSQAENWVTVAKTKAQYLQPNGNTDFVSHVTDCLTAAVTANGSLNLANFKGVALMSNGTFVDANQSSFASGFLGPVTFTVNGTGYNLQAIRVPYEPINPLSSYPTGFSWETHSLIAHEVLHNFGSPHTGDHEGNEYRNPWDAASQDEYNCGVTPSAWRDATYGCLAQHVAAPNKILMGFIPNGKRADWVAANGQQNFTLDRLAQPAGTNPLVIRIQDPTSSRKFLIVEARFRVGYDQKLPGDGVIIYDTDQARLEGGNPNAPFAYLNVPQNVQTNFWAVGTTFTFSRAQLTIAVTASTADTFSVTITPSPNLVSLTPGDLPHAMQGTDYTQALTPTGGTGPYNLTVKGNLPAGIVLDGTTLRGRPTATGRNTFQIEVKDSANNKLDVTYVLEVQNPPGDVGVTTENLATIGEKAVFSQKINGSGGSGSGYTFAVVDGFLPPGITLAADGQFSGRASAPGFYYFTIEITDGSGNKSNHYYELLVDNADGTFDIDPFDLEEATVGVAVDETFTAFDAQGAVTFAVKSGFTLPPGLSFSGNKLTGTPTKAGIYLFVVEATDSTSDVEERGYLLSINPSGSQIILLPNSVRVASTIGTTTPKLKAVGATPTNSGTSTIEITVAGTNGIPADATGIVGVLTNVACTAGGNLRFWIGTTVPNSVALNVPGAVSPVLNLSANFIAPLDANGKVKLGYGTGAIGAECGFVVDVAGYLSESGEGNLNLLPTAVRVGSTVGTNPSAKLKATGANPSNTGTSTLEITIGGTNNIPADAVGVVGVLTNVACTAGGNLRFWSGDTVPNTANINIPGASPNLNLSTGFVAALKNGKLKLGYGTGAIGAECGFTVDVVGYITTPTESGDIELLATSSRLAATVSPQNAAKLVATGVNPTSPPNSSSVAVSAATGGVKNGSAGVLGIVTNVQCTAGGNLRFWTGATVPPTGNLNIPGAFFSLNLSNGFIAPLDGTGKVSLGFGTGATGAQCGYVVDAFAFFRP